jgi:hypothetical protein
VEIGYVVTTGIIFARSHRTKHGLLVIELF